jgi:hypothetical protein
MAFLVSHATHAYLVRMRSTRYLLSSGINARGTGVTLLQDIRMRERIYFSAHSRVGRGARTVLY